MKKVYVSLIADILHAGHIKVLKKAKELGEVTVGLLTLKACGEMNDIPFLEYEHREEVLKNLRFVDKVIPQKTASYLCNLESEKPDFVVHGDDWQKSWQCKYREEVVCFFSSNGGDLIEIPYSHDISNARLKAQGLNAGIIGNSRQARLKRLIQAKSCIRVMETHSPLSALIVENTTSTKDSNYKEFDAFWSSSLTDSTAKGKPDIEAVDTTARLNTINEIFEVTSKPLVYDGDTGGKNEHFEFTVKSLERVGASAIIIEDKTGLKKNSLFGNEVAQTQDSIDNFCEKIKLGKAAQLGTDFMIIARIESLILEAGMEDALKRAKAYVEAGADGVMIHSRKKNPEEIFTFIEAFRAWDANTVLVIVPTSYNKVTFGEFKNKGVNIVIYANHMLRAAIPNMKSVAQSILDDGRSYEADQECMSIKDILHLIPGTK